MSNNPYTTPENTSDSSVFDYKAYLEKIAKLQKWLMLSLVGIFSIIPLLALIVRGNNFLESLAGFLIMGYIIFMWSTVFRLAKLMEGIISAIIYLILSFIPIVNIFVILMINRTALNLLKKGGYKVGFLASSASKKNRKKPNQMPVAVADHQTNA